MTILPGQVLAIGTDPETHICRAVVGVEPDDVSALKTNLARRKVVIVDPETANFTNAVGCAMALSRAIARGDSHRIVEIQTDLDHYRRDREASRDIALRILTEEVLNLLILLGKEKGKSDDLARRLDAALNPHRMPGREEP
ncbi:hypothetical protein OPIT5_03995 [Opitutaceae bacterium TAV5]|nr:hypothetical protein OPIT5_03995 [Opitutaceae bacterium TAV5]